MTIERQALVGLKWSAIGRVVGQTITWAVTLIVLRLLSPDDYGLMAITMVLVSVIGGLAEMGLISSLVQAREFDREELARVSGFLLVLTIACVLMLCAGASVAADWFGGHHLDHVIRVSSLVLILNAFDAAPLCVATREMQFRWIATVDFAAAVTSSLVTLLLAWSGAGVWSLVYGNLSGAALRTVLLLAGGSRIWPVFNFRGISQHLKFGGTITLGRLLWQLTYQADVLIAGRFLPQAAVGLYSVAVHLANLPMQKVMGIVNQVAFPTVARLQDDPHRMRTNLIDAIRLLLVVTIPALWGISAVAPELIDVVLGARWHAAIFSLQIVSLVAPLRMIGNILSTAVAAVGRADLELRFTAIAAVLLPLGFLAGVQWGIDGLAASCAVTIPVSTAISLRRMTMTLQLTVALIWQSICRPLFAGIAMYATVIVCRYGLLMTDSWLRLIILIALGALVYISVLCTMDRKVLHDFKRIATGIRG